MFDSLASVSGKKVFRRDALGAFLAIGYVPGTATLFDGITCLPGGRLIEVDDQGWRVSATDAVGSRSLRTELEKEPRDWLLERAKQLFLDAVARRYQPESDIVVPLSGGLDSRAILAALLEFREPWRLHTFTHGLPGTADYEIGNLVARTFGTRHVSMDLELREVTPDRLIETAKLSDGNTDIMQPVVWTWAHEIFGKAAEYWVGYTGDGIGGSHFRDRSVSREEAVETYLSEEMVYEWYGTGQPSLHAPLVETHSKLREVLSPLEAVWFENHVERYTAHHIYMTGLKYQTPFMDDALCDFMFSLPEFERKAKRLFNEVVCQRFPQAFSLPTKDYGYALAARPTRHFGWVIEQSMRKVLWRMGPSVVRHPKTSYWDFALALRERLDVRSAAAAMLDVVRSLRLVDMKRLGTLWDEHQLGGADHSQTLTLLASLGAIALANDVRE